MFAGKSIPTTEEEHQERLRRSALEGRDYVVPDDIKALATGVLRHRLILSAAAEIEGREVETIVGELIESTEAPR